ncbi:MAG: AMP-binding protein [Acidimicrobiales bacterium]
MPSDSDQRAPGGAGRSGSSGVVPGLRSVPAETVAEYRRRGWWSDVTMLDEFLAIAEEQPNAPAVVTYHKGRTEPERTTYGELERASRRCARALLELGIEVGDAVSLQLPNCWQVPALVFGILRIGAVANPLVPIFREREMTFVLNRTESRVLVVTETFNHFDHATMAAGLRDDVETLEHVLVVGASGRNEPADPAQRLLSFEDVVLNRDDIDDPTFLAEFDRCRPTADDLVEIQFTSGTTGEPKGVLHSHNTIRSGCRVIDEVYGLGPGDVCFMASTLAHQTGFGYGMLKPLSMGMAVVYQDQWDVNQMLDAVETEQIVWTVSATAFAMDMIAAQRSRPRDVATFKYFICGGAPIPPVVVEEFNRLLDAELIAVWGMTENMITTTSRPGDPVELVSDSDGTPVDWMEIRVLGENGLPVGPGGIGALQSRGPNQALGYFHRPDLYAAASPDGDWFDTGDVARLREDHGIRIVGRTKDLVIRGGENIPVAEVEDLLLRHPAVNDVAVVGLADDRLGERACAVVTTTDLGLTLGGLTSFLENAGMARQFWPERLVLQDDMPRTPSGKIQKYQLREQLGRFDS